MYLPCDRYVKSGPQGTVSDGVEVPFQIAIESQYYRELARKETSRSNHSMVRCRACFGELKMYLKRFKNDNHTYLSSSKHITPELTVGDFCIDYLVRSHRKRPADESLKTSKNT